MDALAELMAWNGQLEQSGQTLDEVDILRMVRPKMRLPLVEDDGGGGF